MSLSYLLRTAQSCMAQTLLPVIRPLGGVQIAAGQKFHSMCDNHTAVGPTFLEASQIPLASTVRGMKTKGILHLRCKGCYFVYRKGRKFVMCKLLGRHKQQEVVKNEKSTWRLTDATQSKRRAW